MKNKIFLSIIIPIYNEEKYIKECLESIRNSNFKNKSFEILLVDGGSSDKTLKIINSISDKFSHLKIFYNSKKFAPYAMNIGINNAKGKYVFIISAHAKYSNNYFIDLCDKCAELDADCVGPVLITEVKNKNYISIAIKNVLSDKIGVGSCFRSGADDIKEVDTVPFGCYKREIFDRVGLYNEKLIRNQDIELNKRIKNFDGKIYLIPDIKCIYYARENYIELAKNNFENGRWNILTAYYTKTLKSLSIRHFVPLIFLFSLFLTFVLSFIKNFFLYIFLAIFLLYLSIITIRSIKIKKNSTIYHQIIAFIVLHFSYGLGSFAGILDVVRLYFKGVR